MKKGKPKPKYREKEDPVQQQHNTQIKDLQQAKPRQKIQQTKHKTINTHLPKPKSYIEKQQSSDKHDQNCIICSEPMKGRQAIWNCRQCCKYIHLRCIKKWILNCNKDSKQKTQFLNWSCPQCKYQYSEQMPEYYCFCRKYKNPQYDRELPPHSCGNYCQKKRGPNCPHLCPLRCHKGKCPPCNFQGISIQCCCGKQKMKIKCSDQLTHFICTNKCDKLLSCKKHYCKKTCHIGPCAPCNFKHMVSCHCGKNDDVVSCQLESYSCEQYCGKPLDCGNHKCQQKCHPYECKPCMKKPETTSKCPCGQFDLMMLMNEPRKSCTDPIPLCGMPCRKKLLCGHNCTKSCHQGPCSKCKTPVTQICACSSSTRKAQCWMLFDDNQKYICQKVCRKRKNCGNHLCQILCCSNRLSNIPADHQCTITCQKQLNCGKHTCGMACHSGNCGNCPVLYSQPQFCPCGKTSLRPPITCGTVVPQCDNLCLKQMACGHFCKLSCHYGQCQCGQKVFVKCQCEKNLVQTDCGRGALCKDKCQQTLPCGHICHLQCHKPPCPSDCQKICRKVRGCGHACLQRCHPNSVCTIYPCQTQILIKCECGHRQKMVPCGSTQVLFQKHIACNKTCESMKRFKILYSGKDVYYPSSLVYFGLKNYNYLQKLQQNIEKYIRSQKQEPLHIEFKFGYDQPIKMSMQLLFEKHYHLDSYFSPHRKSPFFTILKTKNTMIPSPNLSHYITLVGKGQIKKNNVPFQASLKFAPMTKDKSDALEGYLYEFQHKYYSERKDKSYYLHFWLSDHAQQAFDLLKQKYPNYPCSLELHSQNIQLEDQVDAKEVIIEETLQKHQKQQQNIEKKVQVNEKTKQIDEEQNLNQQKEIEQMKKILQKSKIGLKKSYPPSSQLVQTIYKLDNQQIDGQQVNWQKYCDELAGKNLGIEASQWRIRAFLIIRAIYGFSKPTWLTSSLKKLLTLYNQEKTKARRLLSHRSFDIKSADDFLFQNNIYLSAHEPEITAYYVLDSFLNGQQIEQFYQQLSKSPQVSLALELVEQMQNQEFEEYFEKLKQADFLFGCSLIALRQNILKTSIENLVKKNKKIDVGKVSKSLMFESQEDFKNYVDSLGYGIELKASKKQGSQIYHILVPNTRPKQQWQNYKFKFPEQIFNKRDVKYSHQQPEQVYDEKYCLLSYFAFGDHKIDNNNYINRLIKALKK